MYSRKPGGRSLTDQLATPQGAGLAPGRRAITDRLSAPLQLKPQHTPAAAPAPVGAEACTTDLPPFADDAFSGFALYLQVPASTLKQADQVPSHDVYGPGRAGPYTFHPHLRDGELLFFVAFHQKRLQNEWVIGPDAVDDFAATADLYAGAAATALPGSALVGNSTADGAADVRDPDSVVKQEASGEAPWQMADEGLDNLHGGGSSFIFARNAHLRLANYVKPAAALAQQLAADVAAGKVSHLDARAQAVGGRNAILEDTRRKISPSARFASRAVKEEGKSLDYMTAKKVRDGLAAYNLSADTRALLDADSALWGQYAAALEAGDDVMGAALRELGESPAVSSAIVKSAGRPNTTFTRLARIGGPVGLAVGALAAADMILDVADDVEGRNWHAAAGELAGFAGGVVGGELGAMGAVWLASLIVPGAGAGVVIVASIIGGGVGAALGAAGGESLVDLLAQGAAFGGGLATSLGAAGGFAGIHTKDHPAGHAASQQLASAIYAADGELARLATAIPQARTRDDLQALQRARLDALANRQRMESLLTAIKLGLLDGSTAQECAPEPVPEPASPELDPPCSTVDDDCDPEVD
jgi:hypothetical protein